MKLVGRHGFTPCNSTKPKPKLKPDAKHPATRNEEFHIVKVRGIFL